MCSLGPALASPTGAALASASAAVLAGAADAEAVSDTPAASGVEPAEGGDDEGAGIVGSNVDVDVEVSGGGVAGSALGAGKGAGGNAFGCGWVLR